MYEYIYILCVFKWKNMYHVYIYILVEVKSFPDGVAEICWKKPMDLRQMMMIHPHFRGELTVFSRLMMWGNFNLEITIWMIHLMAWFWKKALDTMTSSGQHDWYSSMVPQMLFKCLFQTWQHMPCIAFELKTLFVAWISTTLKVTSSLRLEVLVSQRKTQVWRQTVDENFDFLVSLGWIFVHTKTKTAKSTRRPSKKNPDDHGICGVQATPSCSQNAFWVLELGGCWGNGIDMFFGWKGYIMVRGENMDAPLL